MDVSNHSFFLLQQLNVQREFGFLCDCTVAIGNVFFKAHRAVLASFSNYFKMIFIHQSSECIKIQPSDIQPDVFSYLLHIMYTGLCPKQTVDRARLHHGIKFLHAYQLCLKAGEGVVEGEGEAGDALRMSNLYGIQISSQLGGKDGAAGPKAGGGGAGGSRGGAGGVPAGLSLAAEGVPTSSSSSLHQTSSGTGALHAVSSVASGGDDSDIMTHIKQEEQEEAREEEEEEEEARGLLMKASPLELLCPRCGEHCSSPGGLRDHLFRACSLAGVGPEEGILEEESRGSQGPMDAGCLEEALRQSQALANQLAAELRRSRGGGGGGSSPPPALPPSSSSSSSAALMIQSRKRKMACAVCSVRFSHKSALQEHMYTHTGKPSRLHRYNRLCNQILQAAGHFCHAPDGGPGGGGVGGGASDGGVAAVMSEDVTRDVQDNGSSCYSLDSEVSQESVDVVPVE
ncbi:zinc finger and BTB domain-containing protein 25 [Gadus chalcogrammus]|uniref:zinc finger and BTB domain-containing protein 25 n=1 Tax=Gadus chalcogrammus TaxID=1042646 RepID=UPI0024C499C8|nr:zinc finger and BTB domain-containing protein 25 [Gadus chalcogrammus]XP_056436849.1 zinc finger and BTB domain-containing protein 25 [Gadus chalcogrammus]